MPSPAAVRDAVSTGGSRKAPRALLAAACLFCALSSVPSARAASPASVPSRIEFSYDIQFLMFPQAATGELSIRRTGKDHYRAELRAETLGLIGFLTGYQKNHYVSEMRYLPGAHRLQSQRFTKTVQRGLVLSRTVTTLDYEKRRIAWEAWRGGRFLAQGAEAMARGVAYEDMLSAFFNLRMGAYGPLTPGRRLKMPTFPDFEPWPGKEISREKQEIDIFIADAPTEHAYRERYGRAGERGLLAIVRVPKDFFGQKTGEIRVWLDANLVPVAATVENAVLFGDVHGTLRKGRGEAPAAKPGTPPRANPPPATSPLASPPASALD